MSDSKDTVKLGSAVLDPIIKGYKAGGAALALILVGTVLLLAAVATGQSVPSYVAAGAGALTILAILARVYFIELQDAKRMAKTIRDNQALMNSVQESAIQLTDICAELQTLAFKHADKVRPLLKNVRETLRLAGDLPFVGKTEIGGRIAALAENTRLQEVDELSASIVEATEGAKKIIEDLRRALTTLDAKPILVYSKQLTIIKQSLTELLKRGA
jgi:hypothetical protein